MQFLLTAYDGTDSEAMERRMANREAHLAGIEQLAALGKMLYGAALLDDNGKMVGSTIVCDFESRQQLDKWLETEPYVTGQVWQKIEIKRCQVAPSFVGLKPLTKISN